MFLRLFQENIESFALQQVFFSGFFVDLAVYAGLDDSFQSLNYLLINII